MATATKPKQFDHKETQRRIESPLKQIRSTIRRYILLESIALTLLAASLFFWIGLALDFGLFMIDFELIGIHGVDWVLSLNDLDASGLSSVAVRVILLLAVVVTLLALGFYKVGMRWFREFNDKAVALVLERRFPKQLGDRLITAVELADPKLSQKYGYSQAMVEKTIADCVSVLKKLPVSSVFNWGRLYTLWLLVGLSTFGMLLLTMIGISGGSYIFAEKPMDPYVYSWRFYDTASIWTERNVLMMSTYWPRRAHLEIGRFQPSALDANDMRVPLNSDERPSLTVTAYEWVVADRDRNKAPNGWRPLMWKDLAERNLIDADTLARVQIPVEFDSWQLDPDELEPNFAKAVFGSDLTPRASGEVAAYLAELRGLKNRENDPTLDWEKRRAIKAVTDTEGAAKLAAWMDWTQWSVDKLSGQMEVADSPDNARLKLRLQDQYNSLSTVLEQLSERADYPSMNRTLRQLEKPGVAYGIFTAPEGGASIPLKLQGNQYIPLALSELKDSPTYRLRVRGDNYFTPSKTVSLVAAPAPTIISIDKMEPAYIYHRLNQVDQAPLRGVKHESLGVTLPIAGDTSTIELPLGSDLTIHVEIDATNLDWGGLHFFKLTPAQCDRFKLPRNEGVLVTSVDAGFASGNYPNGRITSAEVKSVGIVTVNHSGTVQEGNRVTITGNTLGVANGTWIVGKVESGSFTIANPAAGEVGASGKAGTWMVGGIAVDDVLVSINDQKVPNDLEALAKLIGTLDLKSPVKFDVKRQAGKQIVDEKLEGVTMPKEARYQPRRLRPDRATDFGKQQIIDPSFAPYQGSPPVIDADRRGFSMVMSNITRKHDFSVEFFDEDNIRGKRRFKILSVLDMEPQVGNLNIANVLLRKPKFKAPATPEKEKDKDNDNAAHLLREQAELANAYLITPEALLPFECAVKDDYGLTKIGYNFKVRKADVELLSSGGGSAKVPVMQVNQVMRRANAALVAGNLQFLLPNSTSYFAGKYNLAYSIAVVNERLREAQGYREGYVDCDAFNNLLERKADRVLRMDLFQKAMEDPAVRKKVLSGSRPVQQWEFDFKEDDGFDVKRNLPELKAVDVEKTGQQHYLVQIAVQAIDNNIETGKHVDAKGETQFGAKKTNRNGYINFLVISENELLTQISLEEESITEKLENAKEKVDASLVSLKDQMTKVSDPKADMENVLIRMNEIRTALGAAGSIVRDSEKAYDNIVKEMRVNRVRGDRLSKIQNRIHQPLFDIMNQSRIDDPINPQTGSYPYAEESFLKAHALVEDDVNAKRGPNFATHQVAMVEADRKLRKLSLDIKNVLDRMSEGIVESKLIAILAAIEANQRERTTMIKGMLDRKIQEEIELLLKDLKDDKKKDIPKDDKKPLEKQSSLHREPGVFDDSHAAFVREVADPRLTQPEPHAVWLRRDELS